jgi:hypothetical protein
VKASYAGAKLDWIDGGCRRRDCKKEARLLFPEAFTRHDRGLDGEPFFRTRSDRRLAPHEATGLYSIRPFLRARGDFRLTAGELTPAQADRAQAWLAARQGDRVFERQALESLVASDPGDLAAWKRLAEAARQDGKPEIAAEPEHRQADIARLDDRFHKLFDRNQPIRDAVEMGELAEKLGHTFVAKVFFTVAAAKSLHRDDARRELARLTTPVGIATGR